MSTMRWAGHALLWLAEGRRFAWRMINSLGRK
jgi:hypothetical protein